MLSKIQVKNLAILEDVEVNFHHNMTVLTGQTGAGKSLIIDAIGLLLGSRADTDMIRYGEKEAVVTGVFSEVSLEVKEILTNYGINIKEELIISRRLTNTGKNTIKVNDQAITLGQLKQIGLYLGDIHVQHDTYRLINKDNYLSFLDDFKDKKFLKVYNDYQLKRISYLERLKQYQDCLKKSRDLTAKVDYLIFQKEELEALELSKDLDVELANEIEKLSNFDKIFSSLNEAYEKLNSQYFELDELYEATNLLDSIEAFDEDYQKNSSMLKDAYYQIEEVKSFLYKAKDSLDFDPVYLDELNTRLYAINKAKEKYHKSNNELISYLNEITLELSLATNFDETINTLKEEVVSSYQEVMSKAKLLREYRQKEAIKISKALVKECNDLDLCHTEFEVSFNEVNFNDPFNANIFGDSGIDEIDFLITFNVGEPPKPLSKVASGGELSRIMLAFKILYLNKNPLSLMVFDEIDSGISGKTASKIARKLHEIGSRVQVLAITHLAQVAAISDHHLFISKEEIAGRTKTSIKEIIGDERVSEIALMLSGMELNSSILQTAKEMLEDSRS